MTELWIVGQAKGSRKWEFRGVFSTRELAIAACRTKHYFVFPMGLDESLPHETPAWPETVEWPLWPSQAGQ